MIKILFLFVYILSLQASERVTVVTYSTGKLETDTYESFSFWIKDGQRAHIQYMHGKELDEEDLIYLGTDLLKGEKGFKTELPDHTVLFLIPKGYALKVVSKDGRYLKYFSWENENKADNSGTDTGASSNCKFCAPDEKNAMDMMNKYFLN
jgi:hypothetical protein